MSLAFLAKKSWHTANINNQEKVWLAEQEKEKEAKRLELLKKQMMEEREMDELRKMQGKGTSSEKLNWMYAPVGSAAMDTDEYLMGKPKEADKDDDELKKVVTAQSVGSNFMAKDKDEGRDYRDNLAKIREDPLLMIKQQEKKARERILDNPLKLADFKKELDEKRKRKEDKKQAKAEKKAAKKASKKASKNGGGSDDEGRPQAGFSSFLRKDGGDERRGDAGQGRERERERDGGGRRDDRRRSRSPRRDSPPRRRDSPPRRRDSPPRRRDSRSPPPRRRDSPPRRRDSPPRRRDSRSPPRRRDSPPRRRDDSRSPPRKRNRSSSPAGRGDAKGGAPKVFPGMVKPNQPFGLWRPDGAETSSSSAPKTKPIYNAKAAKDGRREGVLDNGAEAAARYKAGQRPQLSAEDKARRLAEMQQDAARNDTRRLQEVSKIVAEEKQQEKEETRRSAADEEAFLSKMNTETFMASAKTMEGRLSQRKHYRERGEMD